MLNLDPSRYHQRGVTAPHSTGLGSAQAANTGIQIASTSVATVGAINAGLIHSAALTAAIPVIGAVIAGVTLALAAYFSRVKPGQKIATTAIVNEIEPYLEQNRDGYLAGPRTVSSRQQALNNFDAAWLAVVQECGREDDYYGEPGSWCIEDRAGAGRVVTNGSRTWIGNGKFDWFAWYRAPIENDTPIPDPTIIEAYNQSTGGLLIPVVGAVIAMMLAGMFEGGK